MRKLLLLAATVMASFSVNAQVALKKINLEKDITTNIQRSENIDFGSLVNKAPEMLKIDAAGMYGSWISNEYEEQADIYTCKLTLIEKAENVENMNVKVTFKFNGTVDLWVYGKFENNKLSIPAQYINDGANIKIGNVDLGSKVGFFGFKFTDETTGSLNLLQDDFVLSINDDGLLVIDDDKKFDGWFMRIDEGQYAGALDFAIRPEFGKANGSMAGLHVLGKDNVTEINIPVYVNDEEGDISVFGHVGELRIKLTADKDAGTFEMSTEQNVKRTSKKMQDEGYGDFYHIYGVNSENKWSKDVTIKGTWADNVITFNQDTKEDFSGVYCIGTNVDAQGSFYWMGYFANIVVNYSGSVSGISNVTTDTVKKDNRIFNLAGQQVGKDYKGIVIKNGKKMIQK